MRILTFDIEDWFHVLDNEETKTEVQWKSFEGRLRHNMEKIFSLLERNRQDATFFCLGWVARTYPDIIRQIDQMGYEIATHSDLHQLAYEMDPKRFRNDLERSIKSLEDITGKKITTYRAPGFSIKEQNLWAFEVLCELGIDTDCSIFPAPRAHGGLPRFGHAKPAIIETSAGELMEFPINLYPILGKNIVFSGGGYFRLVPYLLLEKMTKRSEYVMTYLHPRDFDPDQPMIPGLSPLRKFKSYYGLGGSLEKLERLINAFEFISLKEAKKRIDWQNVAHISLKALQGEGV